ncbi:hypothetical protein P5704_024280 (plasmid) [Pseudomonas sp. FeN3W]|nr:hypothetical protein P5704_024280 [Pseudomonas sp. FeN3W]
MTFENLDQNGLRAILRKNPFLIKQLPIERMTPDLVNFAFYTERRVCSVIPKQAWTPDLILSVYLDKDLYDLRDHSILNEEIIMNILRMDSDILKTLPDELHTFDICDYSILHNYDSITYVNPKFIDKLIKNALDPKHSNLGGKSRIRSMNDKSLESKLVELDKLSSKVKSADIRDKANRIVLKHLLRMEDSLIIIETCKQSNLPDACRELYGLEAVVKLFGRHLPAKRWMATDLDI